MFYISKPLTQLDGWKKSTKWNARFSDYVHNNKHDNGHDVMTDFKSREYSNPFMHSSQLNDYIN